LYNGYFDVTLYADFSRVSYHLTPERKTTQRESQCPLFIC